jgi:hypothetical protein
MSASGQWSSFVAKLKAFLSEPDSLDTIEFVMLLEETFDLGSDGFPQSATTPDQMVDALWRQVADQTPNRTASALLKKLALRDNQSNLESQPGEPWRREQVEAVLRELLSHRSNNDG